MATEPGRAASGQCLLGTPAADSDSQLEDATPAGPVGVPAEASRPTDGRSTRRRVASMVAPHA